MGSRVHNIKKKFEGLCEASKEHTQIDSAGAKSSITKNSGYQNKKILENGNSTSTVGIKGIVKRSHAFRSDKLSRNLFNNDSSRSLCNQKSEGTRINPPIFNEPYNPIEEPQVIFLSKMLSPQVSDSTLLDESNIIKDGSVLFQKTDISNADFDRCLINTKNCIPPEYSVISKSSSETKTRPVTIRPNSLQLNTHNVCSGDNLNKKCSKKSGLKNCADIPIKQIGKCNLKTINTQSASNKEVERDFEDIALSNTLKKVLKSPLPPGPPPKKPPRTFAHISDSSSISKMSNNEGVCSDDINIDIEKGDGNKTMIKPVRSKTESQIMLKKLEIALLNHKQGKVLEPKFNKDLSSSSRDLVKSPVSKVENCAGTSSSIVPIHKTSLPDTPGDKYVSAGGCFGVLSCSNSLDLNKSSHIYDIPFESKSQFYVTDSKEIIPSKLTSFISKENNAPDRGIAQPIKYNHTEINEPIYAKPQTHTENKLAKSCVSDIIKNINSNGKFDNKLFSTERNDGRLKTSGLHYMSSPIVEKIHFLPTSTEKSTSTQKSLFENNCTKTFPSRSSSFDLISTNVQCSKRSLSVDHCQDISIDNEKIQMMVNEVYSKCLAMPQDSDSESIASTPDEGTSKSIPAKHITSPEEAQKERQQRTAERKTYLKRVCSRTKSFHRPSVDFPHLFEYLLLIGLDLNPARCKVPYIKAQYPDDANIPRGIEQLCFPDAMDWPPQVCADESGIGNCYCIIITNANGVRKYGYCRRVQPEGAPICLPLAYCIVSPYKANSYFGQVLAELESRHGQPEQILSNFIHQLYECPFPIPGQGLHITNTATNEKIEILPRKLDPRQEETDIARLLNLVRFSVFLQLFVTLLLERKVILLSYSISKLSTCIEGLCASLYPFHWQHTLVPIVPSTMLDLCQAPTPYVIGLLKSRDANSQHSITFNNIDQVLVVDVDESRVLQSCGDETTVLPPRLCRGLREALHCAIPEKNGTLSPAHNLIASEALMALFVQLVGHYRDHIITSSATGQREFQRDGFVKSVTSNTVQSFLDWFSETTMFTAFIESRLDRSVDPWGLFEQRCVEHLTQQQAPLSKSYRANINKTVKSFGDRFKEWKNSS